MDTLKIAQFVDTFYPKIDGVVRVVDNYAAYLNSYDDIDCCVFCPEVKKNYKLTYYHSDAWPVLLSTGGFGFINY